MLLRNAAHCRSSTASLLWAAVLPVAQCVADLACAVSWQVCQVVFVCWNHTCIFLHASLRLWLVADLKSDRDLDVGCKL
jgi:hypothetical protein